MGEPLATEVVEVLRGRPLVGGHENAHPLVTVRPDGHPHITLLSRAELDTIDDCVLVALAGRTTPANLDRTGQATLLVIVGNAAHSCDLQVRSRREHQGMTGYRLALVAHRRDSLGIPLSPIGFTTPSDLPGVERWDISAALLEHLAEG